MKYFGICQPDWFAKIPCDEAVRSHPVRAPHPDSIGWALNNAGFSGLRLTKSMDRKCWLRWDRGYGFAICCEYFGKK
jgi:hypothetical protein